MAEVKRDPKKAELLQIFEELNEHDRDILIIVARVAAIRAEVSRKQTA